MSARQRKFQLDVSRRRRASSNAGGPPQFYVAPVVAGPGAEGPQVVDLLHAEPVGWGDLSGSAELVRFAFEGGDCEGVFDTLIEALPLAESDMMPESFSSQLYLGELVRAAFMIRIGKTTFKPHPALLQRMLEHPPKTLNDTRVRQDVLRELGVQPRMRKDFETLYLGVCRLRDALEISTATEPSLVKRKVAVLVALQSVVNALADGFDGAASALSRLRDLGNAIRGRPDWDRLVRLIDLEGNLAAVDIRLRLGSDGTIRAFGVLAINENPGLLPGVLGRWLSRLGSLFRGYRYGENEVVVRLLEDVFAPFVDDVVSMIALSGALEFYLAGLAMRDLASSRGLETCLAEMIEPDAGEREIEGLFNPLLFLQDITPKACDVPIPRADSLVVITGPNSGGKTRFLQALALAQLLGQAGLFVPASRARLIRAPRLFLSLVTDTDASQIEGRLGTELMRIRKLFEQLEPGSMAILDELCSGTNPDEGETIFEMVVTLLPRLRAQVFVSTHFLGMAERLSKTLPHLVFFQVELDDKERPTYRFVPGVATTSLAHKVAARLGVTQDDLESLIAAKLGA